MNRLEKKFNELKAKNEAALIPFITMGDPSIEKTVDIVLTLEANGGDIIELGIPYSDPLADGPVIEAADERSLAAGFKLGAAFNCVRKIREKTQIPLVFMCYYNTIFGYGSERFINECVSTGIDGIIVPDLPIEERDELAPLLAGTGICLIPLAAVTSKNRILDITKYGEGFVYCVSSLGVTGERSGFYSGIDDFLKAAKASTSVPVCVGFGISKKEDAERFAPLVDGVIVGSAIVRRIHESGCNLDELGEFIRALKAGCKR